MLSLETKDADASVVSKQGKYSNLTQLVPNISTSRTTSSTIHSKLLGGSAITHLKMLPNEVTSFFLLHRYKLYIIMEVIIFEYE